MTLPPCFPSHTNTHTIRLREPGDSSSSGYVTAAPTATAAASTAIAAEEREHEQEAAAATPAPSASPWRLCVQKKEEGGGGGGEGRALVWRAAPLVQGQGTEEEAEGMGSSSSSSSSRGGEKATVEVPSVIRVLLPSSSSASPSEERGLRLVRPGKGQEEGALEVVGLGHGGGDSLPCVFPSTLWRLGE